MMSEANLKIRFFDRADWEVENYEEGLRYAVDQEWVYRGHKAAGGKRIRTCGPAAGMRSFRNVGHGFLVIRTARAAPIPEGDQRFESGLLQRRVCELSVPLRAASRGIQKGRIPASARRSTEPIVVGNCLSSRRWGPAPIGSCLIGYLRCTDFSEDLVGRRARQSENHRVPPFRRAEEGCTAGAMPAIHLERCPGVDKVISRASDQASSN